MSPLHAYLDLERLASAQDEFKIEIGGPSLSLSISSSARSDGQASSCSFDFSAAYRPHPHHLHSSPPPPAYADEIFHNGQIRPHYPLSPALCPDLIVRHCAHHLAHAQASCCASPSTIYACPASPHLLPHSSELRTPAPPLCPDHKPASKTAHRRRLSSFLFLGRVSHADDEGCFPSTKALNAASRAGMPLLELQETACSPQCQPHGKPRLRRARTFGLASASRHSSSHAAFSCNPHRTQSNMAKTTFLPYRKGILACIRC